ncbi:fibrobacter succinogenes major paralogous domain-containing protein [uncultured Fibrobacter sp.]|uniref:fibrobacter succinogenes major paralogous domain-containing protein n=1 Tax=uncultured Fibrobacter sp. TaxID=261512 RepID=UPI002637DA80|nr:fibrobacter succinogenes major paralogous domain-containing protein [uncultured Fibrobacter sp.]
MKKYLDLSSWSRKAAIGSMLIVAFAVVGCDDSSSASAGQNDEPAVESSSSSSGKAGEPAEPAEEASSSSEKAKSSSSDENSQSSSSSSTNVRSSSSETESSSSSVSELSSSSLNDFDWNEPKETYLNPEIEYDTIIDSRDGKVYKMVTIGDQVWMAENLNFDPGQGGSGDAKYEWSWCYDNEPRNCDVAGRLYTWAAAIDSVKLANDAENPQECGYGKNCNLPAKVQGVCPPDWHLPTQAEWNTLFLSVGGQYQSTAGKALKSQSGWFVINSGNYFFSGNGTDEFGFCALPVGWEDREGFHDASHFAEFWSSTESTDRDWAYNACVKNYEDEAYVDLPTRKDVGTSVRCVKD